MEIATAGAILTPRIRSIRERLPRRLEDLLGVRQDRALEDAVEADGRERRADAIDGRVEVLEELGRDARDELAAEAAVDLVLVDDEDARRLPHGGRDGVPVERYERAEVENLDALSLPRERLGGVQREVHRRAVREDRQIAALAASARLAERHGEVRRYPRLRLRGVVEELRLEVHRDTARAHRRPQQPRRVVRESGHDDADPGERREPAFDVLRVVETASDVAARGDAHRDVRDELPVRAPELVRHLDHLLGRGPEVVGELGALDDDANLLGEARETVGRAEDEVL